MLDFSEGSEALDGGFQGLHERESIKERWNEEDEYQNNRVRFNELVSGGLRDTVVGRNDTPAASERHSPRRQCNTVSSSVLQVTLNRKQELTRICTRCGSARRSCRGRHRARPPRSRRVRASGRD